MFACEFGYILKTVGFKVDHLKQSWLLCYGKQKRAKLYIWAIFIETLEVWSFDIIT